MVLPNFNDFTTNINCNIKNHLAETIVTDTQSSRNHSILKKGQTTHNSKNLGVMFPNFMPTFVSKLTTHVAGSGCPETRQSYLLECEHKIGLNNNIPTMQFFTGYSRNTQSKSHRLSLTKYALEFRKEALWDTHEHALLHVSVRSTYGGLWLITNIFRNPNEAFLSLSINLLYSSSGKVWISPWYWRSVYHLMLRVLLLHCRTASLSGSLRQSTRKSRHRKIMLYK